MVRTSRLLILALCLAAVPVSALAQASIAGTVKDASGAVLPGVSVEAASPALIEKTRSVVTDGTGQYRIVDLRPGTYTVTFTLTGFETIKREGLELSGTFVSTVNVDMRIGSVGEEITVTGETPIVDVQSAVKQRVITQDVINDIPTSRGDRSLTLLVPGVSISGSSINQDVGGVVDQQGATMVVHGSHGSDQGITTNGLNLNDNIGQGSVSSVSQHVSAYQEVTVDSGGANAESALGGVRLNFIPKDGGNTFKGSVFAGGTLEALQNSNYTDDLKRRGLTSPSAIKRLWDLDPGLGGPIAKDVLWFYGTVRLNGAEIYPPGIFTNLNVNKPSVWTYAPDLSSRPVNINPERDGYLRLTWQATPKNKFGASYEHSYECYCSATISATSAPEASVWRSFPAAGNLIGDWTSPVTNRLLLEGAFIHRHDLVVRSTAPDANPLMVSVVDQALGNLVYRAVPESVLRRGLYSTWYARGAISYVTGAHAFKLGATIGHATEVVQNTIGTQPYEFRFNNGVPNQITLYAFPYDSKFTTDQDSGVYAQDKWTIRRLTVSYGVRFDYYKTLFPAQALGPAPLTPLRNASYPEQDGVSWKDVTPKSGIAYDLFGNGRTALKASLNKYLEGQGSGSVLGGSGLGALSKVVSSTTRAWTDANRDYVPQCDLISPAANGECAALANPNFGTVIPGTTYDPAVVTGWGKRPYNWEFSAGVQHQLVSRVSSEVTYFRRWYGNFFVTDNLALAPSDFDSFNITAPVDASLPNGGGNVISGLKNVKPAKFSVPTQNFVTAASNYGSQVERWNGIDFNVNVRPRGGVLVQGGVATGKTTTDNCEILAQLPELSTNGLPFCHQETPFLTQVKLLASYTMPKVGILLSGTIQSIPGAVISATYNAPNAVVQPSLGRALSGGAANTPIVLFSPVDQYNERLNQVDLRIGKVLRYGRTRTLANIDLYNLFNASTVLAQNNSYGGATPWLAPQTILTARFLKFTLQLDF